MSLTEIPIVKGRVFNRNLNVGMSADNKGPGDTVAGSRGESRGWGCRSKSGSVTTPTGGCINPWLRVVDRNKCQFPLPCLSSHGPCRPDVISLTFIQIDCGMQLQWEVPVVGLSRQWAVTNLNNMTLGHSVASLKNWILLSAKTRCLWMPAH